jgi:hypothetical protein
MKKLRIVILWLARRDRKRSLNDGRIQNPSNPFGIVPLSNFVPRGFGFVHHSIAILYHEVPNPYLTIRDFFIAVPRPGPRTGSAAASWRPPTVPRWPACSPAPRSTRATPPAPPRSPPPPPCTPTGPAISPSKVLVRRIALGRLTKCVRRFVLRGVV